MSWGPAQTPALIILLAAPRFDRDVAFPLQWSIWRIVFAKKQEMQRDATMEEKVDRLCFSSPHHVWEESSDIFSHGNLIAGVYLF